MSMLSKLKQFKDLRQQGKKMQNLLEGVTATGTAAGGQVVLIMDGNFAVTGLTIDPELLTPDKKIKVEAAVKDAHADALKKMQRQVMSKMQESGDFKMPGFGS